MPAGLHVGQVATVSVRAHEVAHLAAFGHWVAFAARSDITSGSAPVNEVWAMDTTTMKQRLVAVSRFPRGQTDWVEGTGDWLFWTDQSQEGDDNVVAMPWTINAQNLATGKRILVATSPFPSPPPIPRAGDGHLVWFQERTPGNGAVTIRVLDTTTLTTTTLPQAADVPSGITAGKTAAVYDILDADGRSNLWEQPWSGSAPRRVTFDDKARNPRMSGDSDTTVWENAAFGDATGLSVATDTRDLSDPVQLGQPNATNAVPGDGFVAFLAGDGTADAVPIRPHSRAVRLSAGPVDVPSRIAVNANLVVYTQDDPNNATAHTITILDVRP